MSEASAGELAHTLQPRHVAMISLGGIIGAGLFVGSAAAITLSGPSVVLSYAACGLLVFLIMRMLGEMAVARPGLGSFAEYSSMSLGRWAGFMTGWLYWYFWVITVGAETIAGANLVHHMLLPWQDVPVWAIGLVLIVAMTATNLLSVRSYGEFEFWFASLKVGAIVVFIVIAAAYVFGFGPGLAAASANLTAHDGLFPKGLMAPLAAVPVVIFSMMGSEVATIAAAETRAPAENVARAARTVSLRILIFYVLSIALILCVTPWNSLTAGESPFVHSMELMHIPGAAAVLSAVVLTAVLSCLNSGLYITSRMLYELARRGDAPARFARVSAARVPSLGILIGGLAGFLAALASIYSPDKVFLYLLQTSGDIILFIYMVIAFGQIRFRRVLQAQGERPALPMWMFPWLSYAVIGGIILVLVVMAFTPDQRQQLAASALSVLIATAAWFVRRSRSQASGAA
jgi:GABA permease